MAQTPVEVKTSTVQPAQPPDIWRSMRTEVDRLFDRFASDFRLPSPRPDV